jgi:hypothetical protein
MVYPYIYDNQFEKYIGQFMRVFSGFQTKDGVARDGTDHLARIPVVYGNMSRVVASVIQRRGVLQNNRIPIMAVNLVDVTPDPDRKTPHHHLDAVTYGDDQRVVERINGPAFNMRLELSVYASSQTEMFSIVEQILLVFNPRITIQVDNNAMNSDYLTEILLESIQKDIQYPLGMDQQVVMMNFNFLVPVRLRYPYNPDGASIQQITLQILQDSQDQFTDQILLEEVVVGELPPDIGDEPL